MSRQLSLFAKDVGPETKNACLYLYFDGAARNNPGPAGIGIVVRRGDSVLCKRGFSVGKKTNNQAEYIALIVGVLVAREYLASDELLCVRGDSNLLIQQMTGQYRVKNPELQKLFRVAHMLTSSITTHFEHVYRIDNSEADSAANQGIDTRAPVPDRYKQVLHEYHITI